MDKMNDSWSACREISSAALKERDLSYSGKLVSSLCTRSLEVNPFGQNLHLVRAEAIL